MSMYLDSLSYAITKPLPSIQPKCSRNIGMSATRGYLVGRLKQKEAERSEEAGPIPLSHHRFSLEINA